MKKQLLLFIFIITLISLVSYASPYNIERESESKERLKTEEVSTTAQVQKKSWIKMPTFINSIRKKIISYQRDLNRMISSNLNKLQKDRSLKTLLIIAFLSFVYGFVHSLGPGHGKVIIASYFLGKKSKIIHGVAAGSLMAFIHALSGTMVVLIFYFFLKKSLMSATSDAESGLRFVTSILIILLGSFMLINEILRKNKNYSDDNKVEVKGANQAYMLSIAAGLVPCPGVILVYLFSINLGVLRFGVVSVISTALGMAAGISLVAVGVIVARNYVEKITFYDFNTKNASEKESNEQKQNKLLKLKKFQKVFSIIGFSFIIISGFFMLLFV
ncbi:MAG: nickel/cobalt transporter [Candidatus Muiribacteriota bacterium]